MKSFNRYKEDTMKSFNRYAAFSLRAILAVTVVMTWIIRPNDYLSRAEPTAFAAEQPTPGALQWRQTSGPEGASIISMVSVGASLYAGTTISGVFRSTNQGESWTPINVGLTDLRVRTFAVLEGRLLAGTLGSGVFVTDVTQSPTPSKSLR
jgi:hypothetical protein